MGAAASATSIMSLVSGCTFDKSDNWQPSFFTADQAHFIRELGELILPRTNTPGAKDASVDRYMDSIRPLRFEKADNDLFLADLNTFITQVETELGAHLHKVKKDKAIEWLTLKDKNSFEEHRASQLLDQQNPRPFYLSLKEQILAAYFVSEVVAKEYFNFDPIPARYDPCIDLGDVGGKAWAL